MDPSKTKSITWDLVEEILKECEYRDEETQVSEILAAFALKLAFQDPVTGYKENEPLSESDVDELVENCIQRILFDFSPSMETIRMQAEYLGQYKSKESILSEHSKALDHRLAPLTRTVVEDSSRTLRWREELYQKIVLLCVLRSGLGDPRDKFVMRESTLAVKSVFPFSELEHFMKKEHKLDKRQHLIELSSIVGGIRIFNWQAKQGTAQFEDLPPMLSNALEATLRNMECMMDYAEEKIKKMRDIGLNVFYFSKENEGHEEKEEYMDPRYKTIIRDSLINYVQFQKYLKVIYEDVLSIRSRLIQYNKQLPRALNAAEKIITSKPILPTIDVFPKFMTLSKIWHQYQEEIIVLSYFNSLNQKLHSFTRSITKSTSLKKLKKLANSRINKKKITFAEEPLIFPIPKASERLLEFKLHYACNVIPHDDVYQVFEFDNGYCPVALAETGLLLKGDKSIGILEYEDKLYVCSDYQKAERFAKAPESILLEVKKLIKSCPTILRLFEMTNEDTEIPKKQNQSSQTNDGLPIEGFKDPDYEWSEWEYRKKALILVDTAHGVKQNELGCQTDESLL